MKKPFVLVAALLLVLISGHNQLSAQETPAPDPSPASPSRIDLVVPDEIWNQVLDNVGFSGQELGYTEDQMLHFGNDPHILRNVWMLFRDITRIPQYSGNVSEALLTDPSNFANETWLQYRMLDATAARQMEYALPTSAWGVDWIPDGSDIDQAFVAVLDRAKENGIDDPITMENQSSFNELPDIAKRLVVRVLIGMNESVPYMREAIDDEFYMNYFGVDDLEDITAEQLYELASGPWQDNVMLNPREAFDMLDRWDMKFFATGSNEFMRHTWGAINEYQLSAAEEDLDFSSFGECEFETQFGTVRIAPETDDAIEGSCALLFDLGGNDTYTGKTAVPVSMLKPVGAVIDLGGNDIYDSGDLRIALACGNHGVGAIFDLDGNDVYSCDESGIGCGWFGTGLVMDYSGDDVYTGRKWTQGSAYCGIGAVIDLDGNDIYNCIELSQGFASTLGCGMIVDKAGNDIYYADPRGNISELYEGRTVNFAQGAAYGRRADFGDGHSMAGGIGILCDGAGDDSYTGSCYVQGCAYWWALGILEDRSGNDSYACEQYSIGSAPHFAIGCCVDLAGDDKYNIGNDNIVRQFQAHARDGSMGVFIDGSGNDEYFTSNLCAGSSDLNCLTMFWDRMGDDSYTCRRIPPQAMPYSFGDSSRYEQFSTFRDQMASIGIFLDTGGIDTYGEILPDDEESAAMLKLIPFADSTEWVQRDEAPNCGYGLDVNWFTGLISEPEPES